jgi:hypothetical protein
LLGLGLGPPDLGGEVKNLGCRRRVRSNWANRTVQGRPRVGGKADSGRRLGGRLGLQGVFQHHQGKALNRCRVTLLVKEQLPRFGQTDDDRLLTGLIFLIRAKLLHVVVDNRAGWLRQQAIPGGHGIRLEQAGDFPERRLVKTVVTVLPLIGIHLERNLIIVIVKERRRVLV